MLFHVSAFGVGGGILTLLLALQAFPAILALPALYLILLRLNLLNTHTGLVLIYSCGAIAFNVWNVKDILTPCLLTWRKQLS